MEVALLGALDTCGWRAVDYENSRTDNIIPFLIVIKRRGY